MSLEWMALEVVEGSIRKIRFVEPYDNICIRGYFLSIMEAAMRVLPRTRPNVVERILKL